MANGVFEPGTGTLKSTTLASAFAELALLIQSSERVALANEALVVAGGLEVPDNIAIAIDLNTDTMSITCSDLPITAQLVSGNLTIYAQDYLNEVKTYVPSITNTITVTDSDLTKTTRLGALFELAQIIQEEEENYNSALTEGQEPVNNLNMSIDMDALTATITANFAITPTINSSTGAINVVPVNYLDLD